ncbi:LamB/YcsF family protein [Pseudonocardia asaccharolytica]|uniref:LamB/YcsF family protein n=1 Tax=Pseudonocardia asaccharolytica DSM 44247 = NBRC 16224 TaxID=1123024 RepID=A0A511CXS3_9PSEU|nr:LamB/YcsF family protein [Pseudonocardia asaccharolytica]GEL17359.1 LamB/YcsF family protein [Pseudonocardia asaccharolytica DSM 44247 = NBRC 16224]
MVAINCDMGEAFSIYHCGDDEGLMPLITLANVACGFHASDPRVMRRTVALAQEHGVRVGAHPSLPDREGFGRREMKLERDELTAAVIYQVGALSGFLRERGMQLSHIKPHGSLYGMAARDEQVAEAIADAADVFGVPLMGMSGTAHERVWGARGFIAEYYADLDYRPDGSLIITRVHEAFDPAESARGAVRAVTEGVTAAVDGTEIPVRADCVCVHSDTPNAVEVAKAVNEALQPYLSAP